MEKLTEQRVREIVREELEAAIKATADRTERTIVEQIEKQFSCDTVQGLYK